LGQSDPVRDGLNAHAIGSVLGHKVQDGFDDLLLASFTAQPRPWLGDIDERHVAVQGR
jgi:hypothetical protein